MKLLRTSILISVFACSSSEKNSEENQIVDTADTDESTDTDEGNETADTDETDEPIQDSLTTFIMGHSLLLHEHHNDPNIDYETYHSSVPQWFALFAQEAALEFSVAGQYGFLANHADLPPIPQWGFQAATSAWNDENMPFGEVGFNSLILTAGNFIQYQGPEVDYYGDTQSPLDYTGQIFSWMNEQEPNIHFFIYENWPDMGGFITPDENDLLTEHSNPARTYMTDYNAYTLGEFHRWWVQYYQALQQDFSGVRMIPVGPVLADLIENTAVGDIPLNELYEDSAPHGRPNIYLLASMVTFKEMYGVDAPEIELPEMIHPLIRDNYGDLSDYISVRLEHYHSEIQ